MSAVATAIVVSGVAGALISSNASRQAAKSAANAANRATDTQWRMYEQGRDDQAPWREAGAWSLGQLRELMAPGGEFNRSFTMQDYQADPGYAFRLQQGQKSIEQGAAARGGLLSGGSLKALSRYSQGLASQEYGNAYDRWRAGIQDRYGRLSNLAGLGQSSVSQTGALGQNAANQIGGYQLGAGNAAMAAGMNTGQQWGNAFNTIGGLALYGGQQGWWGGTPSTVSSTQIVPSGNNLPGGYRG